MTPLEKGPGGRGQHLRVVAHVGPLSAAAKTAVRLWCMERQTYRTIITNKSKKRREQLMGFLKMWVPSQVIPPIS